MEDKQVAEAVSNKDEVVFNQVVRDYSKLLWVVAYSILGKNTPAGDVEELISDVFFRFWKNADKYDSDKSSLKTYLVLITKSMAINKSKTRRQLFELEDEIILEHVPETVIEQSQLWQFLFEAIETLNEPTKSICMQRFFYEMKPALISQRMDLTIIEVNNRLYQGKRKIRKKMFERMEAEKSEKR